MSRNTQYQFISTDTNTLVSALVSGYEKITGISVQPASPEKLFIQWVADIIIQERVQNNYTGNQNIPSRASGENLDALGELFYVSSGAARRVQRAFLYFRSPGHGNPDPSRHPRHRLQQHPCLGDG